MSRMWGKGDSKGVLMHVECKLKIIVAGISINKAQVFKVDSSFDPYNKITYPEIIIMLIVMTFLFSLDIQYKSILLCVQKYLSP